MTTADPASASNEVENDAADHDHAPSRWNDVDIPKLLLTGFVSCVITYVSIIGCQAFYYYTQNSEMHAKGGSNSGTPVQAKIDRQKAVLTEYRQYEGTGKVSIPIENAMAFVLDDLTNDENK